MSTVPATLKKPVTPSMTMLLDALKKEIAVDLNCVKIGIIKSFNAVLQEAEINIAYQQITSVAIDGTKTIQEFPLLINVPVQFPSGGGFTLTFPIAPGDECLVLFNDRQIDNWLINGTVVPPEAERAHDLSDAIAIVGIRNNTRALANVSTTSTQLRSDDGATFVEVAGGGIVNVVAPVSINLTAPTVTITASSQVNVSGGKAIFHGITEATFDAGGTGFVYTPALITTYTDGVATAHSTPTPPQVPT